MTYYSMRDIKIKDPLPKNTFFYQKIPFFAMGINGDFFLFQTHGTGKSQNFEQGSMFKMIFMFNFII